MYILYAWLTVGQPPSFLYEGHKCCCNLSSIAAIFPKHPGGLPLVAAGTGDKNEGLAMLIRRSAFKDIEALFGRKKLRAG